MEVDGEDQEKAASLEAVIWERRDSEAVERKWWLGIGGGSFKVVRSWRGSSAARKLKDLASGRRRRMRDHVISIINACYQYHSISFLRPVPFFTSSIMITQSLST